MRGYLLFLSLGFLARPAPAQEANPRPFKLDELRTPPGFEVSVFARVSGGPRHMAFGPNGVLYVAARNGNTVYAIPAPDRPQAVLTRLGGPHSLAFRENDLYISQDDGVVRFRNAVTDNLTITSQSERVFSLPAGGGHSTRTVGFSPDGRIFATAGSTCNFCVEDDNRRAAMMRYEPDGSGMIIYARGLRNSVGFAWHPVTGDLWAVENGGDGLGNTSPPEEVNIIREQGDYGWPDCIAQAQPNRWGAQARVDRCPQTIGPEFEMPAHSAPLGISFYHGDQFPGSYQNDALVALHGSWNRSDPSGYKVIRVRAATGHATGSEDLLWGFLDPATRTRSGRPVQAIPGPDGAVYVSDDATGNIYQIRYTGPRINPGGIVKVVDRIYAMYGRALSIDPARFSMTVDGLAAETLYVGENQVNFVVPDGVTGPVKVVITNEKASDEYLLDVE